MLAFTPKDRISATESLSHPFLAMYHVPDDEPNCPKLFDFSFKTTNTIPEIKKLISSEVADFKAKVTAPTLELDAVAVPAPTRRYFVLLMIELRCLMESRSMKRR